MNKGQLFIISGPSGSGKDTVISRVLQASPNVRLSISSVTRGLREGEKEGEKYNYITPEEFKKLIETDALYEYNEYCGNFYGTPKKQVEDWIEQGLDVILEIDVNGAKKIMTMMPEVVSIFILPPSMQVLAARLQGRNTETEEVVKNRLREAVNEIASAELYQYLVVNDVIDTAVADINAIIKSNHLTYTAQKYFLNEVQKDAESFHR